MVLLIEHAKLLEISQLIEVNYWRLRRFNQYLASVLIVPVGSLRESCSYPR